MKLISKTICPFVQRVRIVMEEKDNLPDISIIPIDTKHKPDWFLAISPLGKVPTLQIDADTILFESLVIMNYFEEAYTPKLLPQDAAKKALLQSWMTYCDTLMSQFAKVRKSQTIEEFTAHLSQFHAAFTPLLAHIAQDGGYFDGCNFSLLDAVYAPLFVWCDKFLHAFGVNVLPDDVRLKRWAEALLTRCSVKTTQANNYDALLEAYLLETNPKIVDITNAVNSG